MGLYHPLHPCQGDAQGNSPMSPKAAVSQRSCWGHCSCAVLLVPILKPTPCYHHLIFLNNIKQRPLNGWTCSGMDVPMGTHQAGEEACKNHVFWSEARRERREVEGRCRNGQHTMVLSFLLIPLFSFP